MKNSHYVIVYDSDNDASRRKVRSAIRAFGGWKQYSVFECLLTPTMRAELVDELRQIASESEGEVKLRIYKLPHGADDILTIPESENEPSSSNNII